jgi:hypothetical protein
VDAQGDTGEADPMRAIEDALANFDADRIIMFTRPESSSAIARTSTTPSSRSDSADPSSTS